MALRAMWTFSSVGIVVAGALAGASAGCRSCAEEGGRGAAVDSGPAQPAMPPGMLMPIDAAAAAPSGASPVQPLRVAHGVKSGAWTELQIANPGDKPDRADFQHWRDDSSFVSLEAMTLMHEAFARALPGFDLFLPRLFGPEALTRLATELEAFAQRSSGDIASTARELAQLARTTAAKGQSLWVLGA
jgi:hypothetical protein